MTAAANVHELVLSGHSGAHSTHKVDRSLDIDIDCLVERVELKVRSDGTGNIAQLQKVNTPSTTGQAGPQ